MRESAALSVLPTGAPAPTLLRAGAEPPVVVLADLGAGPSVADALLGDDPATAERAGAGPKRSRDLHRIRGLRGVPRGTRRARRRTTDRAKPASASNSRTPSAPSTIAARHSGSRPRRGPGRVARPRAPTGRRRRGRDHSGRCVPGQQHARRRRLVLLDFEGAEWRHVAWDLAYLRVPWPTCWCSWRLPDCRRRRSARGGTAPWPAPGSRTCRTPTSTPRFSAGRSRRHVRRPGAGRRPVAQPGPSDTEPPGDDPAPAGWRSATPNCGRRRTGRPAARGTCPALGRDRVGLRARLRVSAGRATARRVRPMPCCRSAARPRGPARSAVARPPGVPAAQAS